MFRAMAVDSSVVLLSCSISTIALESPSLLSSSFIMSMSLQITIKLTMALMAFCLSIYKKNIHIYNILHLHLQYRYLET
mgnify:CR=1 FL=1